MPSSPPTLQPPASPGLLTIRNGVLGIIVAVLLLAAAYYYMNYFPSQRESNALIFNKQFADLKSSYFSGEYGDSIQKTKELLNKAISKEQEGYLKIFLAAAYIRRDQNDDTVQGIKLYKEVVNDPAMTFAPRARALTDIASVVAANDLSFYKLYFPEAPFNGYIPSSGDEYSKVKTIYFKILQLSDQTYPTSQAEYAIAANYYATMIANGLIPRDGIKEAAKNMQKYVTDGESRGDDALYSDRMLIQNLLNRAIAKTYSATLLGNTDIKAQEQAYKDVLGKAGELSRSRDPEVYRIGLLARFYYANFLLISEGHKRDVDISTILVPFKDATTSVLGSASPYIKSQAPALADISVDFKKYWDSYKY